MSFVTYIEDRVKLVQRILSKTGVNIQDPKYSHHYFTEEFNRIFSHFEYEQYRDRILYFLYFLEQLEKLRTFNNKDFAYYLKKLSNDDVNVRGEIFEILTYAKLLDRSIHFSKPKSNPDFEIKLAKNLVFIECGTRQTDKKGFFIESIEQAITKKQSKGTEQGYANCNTALHIEITRTVYNSYGESDFLDNHVLEKLLSNVIKEVDFGAVVLITTFYSKENGMVYGHPIIEYSENCNIKLKELHQLMFDLKLQRITPVLKDHV